MRLTKGYGELSKRINEIRRPMYVHKYMYVVLN